MELIKEIGIRYVSVDAYLDSVDFYKNRYFIEFITIYILSSS